MSYFHGTGTGNLRLIIIMMLECRHYMAKAINVNNTDGR